MTLDRRWAAVPALLGLAFLSPSTSHPAADKGTASVQTAGEGPAVLTQAELDKLGPVLPVNLSQVLPSTAAELDTLPPPSTEPEALAGTPEAPTGPPEKLAPVRTIVVGPVGLTEQEIRKLQAHTAGGAAR